MRGSVDFLNYKSNGITLLAITPYWTGKVIVDWWIEKLQRIGIVIRIKVVIIDNHIDYMFKRTDKKQENILKAMFYGLKVA